MSAQAKTLTFISRHGPYDGDRARACLDMVMAAAVFDQTIHYVFMDDGVWQLRRNQQAEAIHARSLSANMGALPLYGVEKVYADARALTQRGLDVDDLVLPAVAADEATIRELIDASDQVFSL